MKDKSKLKYIPNILSGIRILLVPAFIYLFFEYYDKQIYVPLCAFLFAGATDVADGYLARRNGWITNLGKLLDPLADKLMQCSVLICFAVKIPVLWWLAGMFVLKELFMICGALIVLKKIKVTVKSHWYGKITTAVFYAVAVLVFVFGMDGRTAIAVFMPALVLEMFCMVMYIFDTLRISADLKKKESERI
ncbi:MAG: CDP-alcohol phosphatidyltransferase family protein [Oscillospiraceae bacterium]|nr:CDP-alcohol phosphatidyltransferase family protein [Oscillospiraceae bacterium]